MINQDAIAAKATVGTATAGAGLANFFEVTQSALNTVGVLLGVTLTSWLLYKEYRAEKERRASKKLQRRSTDRDDNNAVDGG